MNEVKTGHLVAGQVKGSVKVGVPGLHQVAQRVRPAAEVHVKGMAAQRPRRPRGKRLQLRHVLPWVALAVCHHHERQLQLIHL